MTRANVIADLSRAVRELYPDRAEAMMRIVEKYMGREDQVLCEFAGGIRFLPLRRDHEGRFPRRVFVPVYARRHAEPLGQFEGSAMYRTAELVAQVDEDGDQFYREDPSLARESVITLEQFQRTILELGTSPGALAEAFERLFR